MTPQVSYYIYVSPILVRDLTQDHDGVLLVFDSYSDCVSKDIPLEISNCMLFVRVGYQSRMN